MSLTLTFFHGRPACGKDTQADLLTKELPQTEKISGLYRSALKKVGPYAKYHNEIAPYVKPLGQGIEIPGKVVSDTLDDIIKTGVSEGKNHFLICGILRTPDHLHEFDEWLKSHHDTTVNHIYLATNQERALTHASSRKLEAIKEGPARVDDTTDLMKARLVRFNQKTIPMLKELQQEGRLNIIRADKPIDQIHHEIRRVLFPSHQNPESINVVQSGLRL